MLATILNQSFSLDQIIVFGFGFFTVVAVVVFALTLAHQKVRKDW